MKHLGKLTIAIMALLIVAFVSSTAFAGEAKETGQQNLLGIINQGGAIGYIIILMSVAALALTIEHFMNIRRDVLVPPELLGHIESLFEEEEYEEAMTLCESTPGFLTNIIAAGLPKIGQGYEAIEASMSEAGEQEATKLHQKISYLSLIANLSPMLGLFGTVVGMIIAFNKIAGAEVAPSPRELASGISMALVTTALGLTVAIPTLALFFFFRNKVIRVVMEVGTITEELMDRFRPVE